jgi:hydroxyacylglutathione hydrolase
MPIKQFTFNPFQENTFVVYDHSFEAALIDCGCYNQQEQSLLSNWLENNGAHPAYHLLTHAHIDHIFGLDFVLKTYGLNPYLHQNEKPLLEAGAAVAMQYGLEYTPPQLEQVFDLKQSDVIKIGELELEVLETPGHSPGGVSFVCHKEGWVIAGDALFHESIGRTDLPGSNHSLLVESIQQSLYKLPDEYIVYCGHGSQTTIEHEKAFNPFVRKHH